MAGPYTDKWQGLRNLQRRVLFVVIAGVLIFILVQASGYAPELIRKLLS
jgi:hypothetical protein